MRTAIPLLLLLSSVSTSLAQGLPDIGQWVTGPKGNRHDLVPDAMTSAQLAMVGGSAPLTNQATVFLGCKGNDAGPPTLELRYLVQQVRGFVPGAVNKTATLAIDDDKFPASLDIFAVQNATMIVVIPSPAELKKIATIKLNQRANLNLNFQMAGRNGLLLTMLMDPEGPVSTVLQACGVSVPAQIVPTSTATPAMRKFTFQGLYLGMPIQQARAVEKSIATTPIKPGPAGGVDFETAQFYFINVSNDDKGLIKSYEVCGKTSKTVKSGPKSGPLYDTAVKAFGPPTGKPPGTQTWVQWDTSGGVNAHYDWDADEGPGGCLHVMLDTH